MTAPDARPATRAQMLALGWLPPAERSDAVRFWIRADDMALTGIRAVPGWTVVSEFEDPHQAGTWIVEVSDPYAPAAAEGLICEPILETLHPPTKSDPGEPDAPTLKIADYGIPTAA